MEETMISNKTIVSTIDHSWYELIPPTYAEVYGTPNGDALKGGDALFGSHIYAGRGDDTVHAGSGDDTVYGGRDNDLLFGEAGNDYLYGEHGDDLLDGGTGADVMDGGIGSDKYFVDNVGDKVVELPDFSNPASSTTDFSKDTVSSMVDFTLPPYVENLVLDPNAAFGSAIVGHGNSEDNEIVGNGWDNTLCGWGGNDLIQGGAGSDFIWGGDGRDGMVGGAGADTFAWFQTTETGIFEVLMDAIKNFSPLEGDRIDLSVIDADPTTAWDDAFTCIGQVANDSRFGPDFANFTAPGQIAFEYVPFTSNLIIWLNTDSADDAEAGITLNYADAATFASCLGSSLPNDSWFVL
jgi:serralysin